VSLEHRGIGFMRVLAFGQREQLSNPNQNPIFAPILLPNRRIGQPEIIGCGSRIDSKTPTGFLEQGTMGGFILRAKCLIGYLVSHFMVQHVPNRGPGMRQNKLPAQGNFTAIQRPGAKATRHVSKTERRFSDLFPNSRFQMPHRDIPLQGQSV
jgi:hypothetical protein